MLIQVYTCSIMSDKPKRVTVIHDLREEWIAERLSQETLDSISEFVKRGEVVHQFNNRFIRIEK